MVYIITLCEPGELEKFAASELKTYIYKYLVPKPG